MIKKNTYEYEEISIVDSPIPKNATTEAVKLLFATLNFIVFRIKLFEQNYEGRCGMYNKDMKNMFQKTPTIKSKPLS